MYMILHPDSLSNKSGMYAVVRSKDWLDLFERRVTSIQPLSLHDTYGEAREAADRLTRGE